MKNVRWPVGLLALATTALVVAGTAGGAQQKEGISGTVEIIAKWTGGEQDSFMKVLEPFKKANPDIEIKYQGAGDNTPQIVSTAVQGGNPPNLAVLPQPGLMRQFVQSGSLKPISFARSLMAKNFSPAWLALGTVKGNLYGLYFKASNKSTVWYNVKSFKDAGVKTPATWPAFLKAAKTIRASGLPAYSIAGANGWTLTDLFENIYLRTAGPAKFDLLTTHKIKWTDPTVKVALKTMGQVLASNNMAGGKAGALQTDFPTSVANVFATSPKAAMVIEADFVPGAVTDNPLKPVSGFNEFAFPKIGAAPAGSVLAGGDVVVMFKSNPATEALVKYLATAPAATIWAELGGYTSPNKNVKKTSYKDALNRKTAIALVAGNPVRYDMSDLQPAQFGSTTGQGEWKLFQDFLSNTKNVNGIAAKLEAAAAKAYK